MKSINKITFACLAILSATLLLITQVAHAGDHQPKIQHGQTNITFQKCFVGDAGPFGGHFEGTVNGECGPGTVGFTYIAVLPGERTVRFSGEYTITTQACLIKAVCGGTLDTQTGRIVLNGVVTDGPLLGNRVQLRAQLNAAGNCSSGRIAILPGE